MVLLDHPWGNYRFLKGIAPYSAGVVANPGFEIVRVRLRYLLPLEDFTFDLVERYLSKLDQPMHALCAMELRIKSPLSFDGFRGLNGQYQEILKNRGLLLGDVNPIARTNISPAFKGVKSPSVYAFSYTAPVHDDNCSSSFIVAGAGDLDDQSQLKQSAIVRPGETSADALSEKAGVVMKVMQERLSGLLASWEEVSAVDVYTVFPIHAYMEKSILKPMGNAALQGITWHYSNPPIEGLAYEMDVRGIRKELVVEL